MTCLMSPPSSDNDTGDTRPRLVDVRLGRMCSLTLEELGHCPEPVFDGHSKYSAAITDTTAIYPA